MTQTIEPGAEASASPAQARVDRWLGDFEVALTAREIDRVTGMFAVDSFWRDLVSFTWNITTVEGRDGVADMLTTCLDSTAPSGFRTTETPSEADGVTEAWIEFETATGRGRGHLRLRDEGAWTLLTTLRELKGFEEPQGTRRPQGVAHGGFRDRRSWAEQRELESAELGYARQPYVVVIGGGQGASRSVPGCASSASRHSSSNGTTGPVTSGASGTRASACTTPSGTTTCPTCRSPPTGRSSPPRTRSPTGWRCTPA